MDYYRELVEDLPEPVARFTPDFELIYANEAYCRYFGRSREELIGRSVMTLLPEEDREGLREHLASLSRENPMDTFESRGATSDEEVRWQRWINRAVYDGEGRLAGYQVVGLDSRLKENEARFRSLIQNASDIIAILDSQGTILYQSPSIEKVLGYDPEELIGNKLFDYIHPDDRERTLGIFAEHVKAPGSVLGPVEYRFRRKDGSWRTLESVGTNLLEDPNLGGVVANSRDVTERREAEERYRDLFENAAEGIYQSTPDGRFINVNPAMARMFGYDSPEEVVETLTDIGHQFYVDPGLREEFMRLMGENGAVFEFEYRVYRKDRSVAWISENARTVRDAEGEPLYYEGFMEDITERKRTEEALRASERRLRTVIEQSPLAIHIFAPDGRSLMANAAWARLWDRDGLPEGSNVFEDELLRVAGLTPHVEESVARGVAVDTPLLAYDPMRAGREGDARWLRGFVYPVKDESGRVLEFALALEDVTGRKRIEENLKESEEFHRAVVEQSVECIYLFDPETKRILESNEAFEELLGYGAAELGELALYDFIAHEKEDIDRNVERHVMQGQRFVGERRYRRRDGSLVHVEASAAMIPYYGREVVCCVVRDVTERKVLEEQLRHRAFYDELTGLPNRALFLDRLGHALDRSKQAQGPVAVLFVDLDDFKVVNDSLGHEPGDQLLVEVTKRLEACVRPGDTVARLFGDEFTVLLEAPTDVGEARRIAELIQENLRHPFDLNGREVFVSSSIGIALSIPEAEDRPKDVLRRSDLAMYAAKRSGKDAYELFNPSMNTRALERMELENDLRRAVERGEFEVRYQPIIELETGEIRALEALARWKHPERGYVEPSEFIDLAEETGLIRPVGGWVFGVACRQAREWRELYPGKDLSVSVNFSASQLAHQADSVPRVLSDTGLDPGALQLEITERAVMDNAEFALGKLQKLKDLGVSFAIDDYGTGYSCLRYLKIMPVDYLKIDGSFIAGLGKDRGDTAIVSGTIDLAHALGLKVVAEGVETAEQLTRLGQFDCDLAQGKHLAEPLTSGAVSKLLAGG